MRGASSDSFTLQHILKTSLVRNPQMRGQISHFTMLNRRFAAFLRGSSAETYTKTAAIYHELSNVEKRIDHHIALLRTDEFKETECMGDIFRFVHQKLVTLSL